MKQRIRFLCGVDLKFIDLFQRSKMSGTRQDLCGKWASVVCVVLQRPRRLVSSVRGGQSCFHFRKPQGRPQAKTFPRGFLDLRRCKSINASISPEGEPKVSRDPSVVLRSLGFVVSSGFKRQSDTVDAESLACWLRSVVKHMSQMSVTLANKRHTHVECWKMQSWTWATWVSWTPLTFLQRTSVPALPRLLSGRRMMEVWLSSCPHVPWASLNDGQPVPESYLASELLRVEFESFQQGASIFIIINNNKKKTLWQTWKGEHHSTRNGTFPLRSGSGRSRWKAEREIMQVFLKDQNSNLKIIVF